MSAEGEVLDDGARRRGEQVDGGLGARANDPPEIINFGANDAG